MSTTLRRTGIPAGSLLPALRALATLLVLGLAAVPSKAAVAPADSYADARRQFIDAYQLATSGPTNPAVVDSAALRDYPLYPYLLAARLQRRVAEPDAAADLQSFLDRYGAQPAARPLRREWLMTLALRKDWNTYLAIYRGDPDDTVAGRCNAYAARIALGRTDGMTDESVALWSSPKALPPACDPLTDWLRTQGLLTPGLIERRARAALDKGEAGLARYLARSLPEPAAEPINQWAALIEQPRASVDAYIAAPERSVDSQALLDGWQRYARSDALGAADRYPVLVQSRKLDARAASPFAIAVGVPLALARNPRALEFFALGHPDDFDERAHEWHARAALWAGDWTRVRKAIDAMPDSLRSQNRWKYWSARAAEQLGDSSAAKQGYAAVLPTDNWYAVLSAARLGQTFAPTLRPAGLSDAEMERLATDPAFVRTHELILCDMQTEAVAEWKAAYDALTPSNQVQAVGLAASWGWYLQAIAAAAKIGLFSDYELLYPRPYDAEVHRASLVTGLPQDLIYAIIRQESLYRVDARSSADALGLMQLLPSTARQTAKAWHLPAPTRTSLVRPSENIPLGAAYLRSLIDRFGGQIPLAIASYNAGPGAVGRWLPDAPVSEDVWVENIPYNETRGYVQRVSWHMVVFGWLDSRKPRDVAGWTGNVRRASSSEAVPAAVN